MNKRAAIYVRVSSNRQEEEGTSLATQEEQCRAYASAHGYSVDDAHIYRETHTGVELWERPRLNLLRQAIRANAIDAVIFYVLDRFSRDPVHQLIVMAEATQYGIEVYTVLDDLDASPEGQLVQFVKGYAAKREWQMLKERSIRGRRARAENGKYLPSAHPPYGYVWADDGRTKLASDPVTSRTIQWMFARYAAGWSLRRIALQLTDDGIPTARGKTVWKPIVVRQMLANPTYRGQVYAWSWKKLPSGRKVRDLSDAIALPAGTAPALVDDHTWNAVQQRLENGKHAPRPTEANREVALLRGGFVVCGYCGWNATPIRNSEGYWYYRCGQIGKPGCTCPAWTMSVPKLDAVVLERVKLVAGQPDIIRRELEQLLNDDPTSTDIAALDRALSEAERQRDNLVRALATVTHPEAQAPIVTQLDVLGNRIAQLQQERETVLGRRSAWQAATAHVDDLSQWCQSVTDRFGTFGYEDKRLALHAFGVRVTVYRTGHDPRYLIEAAISLDNYVTSVVPS